MDLDEVADELYGLPPGEFTAARNDRARQARTGGQRELAARIRELRRPSLAAWASNLLVREQPEAVEPLLRLGRELRGAHRNLDGEELRALSRQQHQLVGALARQAAELAAAAGQSMGDQARQELAQTLQAVLADPDSARTWAAGRLSKPLSVPVGFDAAAREAEGTPPAGSVKQSGSRSSGTGGAKSRAGSGGRAGVPARERETAGHAGRDARRAEESARGLRQEAGAAGEDAQAARTARREADERAERLRGELREAEEDRSRARKREREADRVHREKRRAADDAGERARLLADGPPGRDDRGSPAGRRKGH